MHCRRGSISDKKTPKFDELYEKLNTELRNANRKYESQLSANEALATRKKDLETEAADLRIQLADTRKERDDFKVDALKAEELRSEIASLTKQAKDALDPSSDSVDGLKKSAMAQELVRTRYAAYGGWGCAALLSLGLLAAYIYYKPLVEDAPGIVDPPTHRIE